MPEHISNEVFKYLVPDIDAYQQMPLHLDTPVPPKRELSAEMANEELCRYEEYGSLWLWADPALLVWPHDVVWLFSPVVGNHRFPGDLWGVDSEGELIIVETKLARQTKRHDPFRDSFELKGGGRRNWLIIRQTRAWMVGMGRSSASGPGYGWKRSRFSAAARREIGETRSPIPRPASVERGNRSGKG